MKKILSTLLFILLAFAAFAESRNALLIANGKYKNFSSLTNPVPEAEGLKKSLFELGFDVTIVTNASKEQMETAILDFQKKLSANKGIGFFHYGGHAVQVNGENYLIPADADIPDEPRVSSRAVNVSEVMYSMQADTNIVILDSCRNNPLPSGSGRSASRGLQMVKVRPKNSVIVYSAEAGKTAQDGIFTPILTKRILENKELIAVLRDVRNEVDKATNGEQTLGQYDQLKNEVFLAMNVPSRLAKVESEASELDRQLEALRAKKSAAADREEQNRIAMETQRIEAEKKRKELELQQVRDAEARRAAEQKRIEEENAKKNENQRQQEQQFAKMQADNAAKLKEIERLSAATNIDEMVASANSLYQTINNITDSYTTSMNKAIDETKAFYQKKKAEIVKSKYESEAEFADRRRVEEAIIDKQQNQDISALQKKYNDEITDNTAELKRKLKALEGQTELQTGNNIKLTFGEYDAEMRFFPATITDTKNPTLKLGCPLEVKDYVEIEEHYTEQEKRVKQNTGKTKKQKNAPIEYEYVPVTKTRMKKVQIDRPVYIQKCIDTENKINAGGYVGFVEYILCFEKTAKKYVKIAKTIGIKDVGSNKKIEGGEIIDNLGTKDYIRFTKGVKFLGDNDIAVGDIAYDENSYCADYVSCFGKPIGVVFTIEPQVKILHLLQKQNLTWDDSVSLYCINLSDGGKGWQPPTIRELEEIYLNKDTINNSLNKLARAGLEIKYLGNYRYWSKDFIGSYPAFYDLRNGTRNSCFADYTYEMVIRAIKVYK